MNKDKLKVGDRWVIKHSNALGLSERTIHELTEKTVVLGGSITKKTWFYPPLQPHMLPRRYLINEIEWIEKL